MTDEKKAFADAEATKEEVEALISQGNYLGALQLAIASPPVTKEAKTKKLAAEGAAHALRSMSKSDIPDTIEELTQVQKNNCMKYVYKAMAFGKSCGVLLYWHEKLVEDSGIGIIMQAMVDRKV